MALLNSRLGLNGNNNLPNTPMSTPGMNQPLTPGLANYAPNNSVPVHAPPTGVPHNVTPMAFANPNSMPFGQSVDIQALFKTVNMTPPNRAPPRIHFYCLHLS